MIRVSDLRRFERVWHGVLRRTRLPIVRCTLVFSLVCGAGSALGATETPNAGSNVFTLVGSLAMKLAAPVLSIFRLPETLPAIALMIVFAGLICLGRVLYIKYRDLNMLIQMGRLFPNSEREFANRYPHFEAEMLKFPVMSRAWFEFCETLVLPDPRATNPIFKNTIRPHVFFNVDRLEIGIDVQKPLPRLFGGMGLLVTLFSLSAALVEGADVIAATGAEASADFMHHIMGVISETLYPVVASLFIYLILTVALWQSEKTLGLRLNQLNDKIERGVHFITQEDLTQKSLILMERQLEVLQEVRAALTRES